MPQSPITDVWCFLADQKYVRVEHDNGQDLLDDSLKSLADEFKEQFVRIHRSALVAVDRIEKIEKRPTAAPVPCYAMARMSMTKS